MSAIVTPKSEVQLEPTSLTNPTTATITAASFVRGWPLAGSTVQFTTTASSLLDKLCFAHTLSLLTTSC